MCFPCFHGRNKHAKAESARETNGHDTTSTSAGCMQWREWRRWRERSREDKRTRGLADYLNANTMLYRGALFPSRLFYNSICDPLGSWRRWLPRVQGRGPGYACSFIVTLLNLCASIMTTSCSHFVYPSLSFSLSFAPVPVTSSYILRSPSCSPYSRLISFLIRIFLDIISQCRSQREETWITSLGNFVGMANVSSQMLRF